MNQSKSGVISNIRLQSAAGHYVGSLYFSDGCPQPYSRETGYYPSEDTLANVFPSSKSFEEAEVLAERMRYL